MNSARDNIMASIKKGLENRADQKLEKPDFASPIYVRSDEHLTVQFAKNFIERKGIFFFVEKVEELSEEITTFLLERKISKAFVWEPDLIELLNAEAEGEPYITGQHGFLNAEAGISFAECLLARTGSFFLTSAQLSGRRLGIFPPIHIVVAFASQILPDINDGLEFIKAKYHDSLPSMISLVTGASRTADIEKTLVLGAHGPKELAVFLVDDLGD
jgi:L-lactate dehydrogenase complex protein LldG